MEEQYHTKSFVYLTSPGVSLWICFPNLPLMSTCIQINNLFFSNLFPVELLYSVSNHISFLNATFELDVPGVGCSTKNNFSALGLLCGSIFQICKLMFINEYMYSNKHYLFSAIFVSFLVKLLMLHSIVPYFEPATELKCCHANQIFWAILLCEAVNLSGQMKS